MRPPGVEARLGALSGGNQQKVALAKWLTRPPKVLVLVEPTRGMDVGAKEDVVRIVKSLAAEGMAVIVLSTEPETVLSLADRVLVMRKGELAQRIRRLRDQQGPPAGGGVRSNAEWIRLTPTPLRGAADSDLGRMLRDQLRNIAPFATLLILVGFFTSPRRPSRRSAISTTSCSRSRSPASSRSA